MLAKLTTSTLLLLVISSIAPVRAAACPGSANDPTPAHVVIDWNQEMVGAIEVAQLPPPPAIRIGAIVQASVFDAVNGITHRYRAYHVTAPAPCGARAEAAAAGAAHEALSTLFPSQRAGFDALLTTTLSQLTDDGRHDRTAVERGVAWGTSVADDILAWRAGDGVSAVPPPYVPDRAPGRYQPTPPMFGAPAFRQFATMTPFAISSPAQFLPPPPPALTSARYTHDFAEVVSVGSAASTTRSAFDTQTATLWNSDTPVAIWDRVADELLNRHAPSLTGAARLLAQTNLAMADAVIAIWNAKNYYDRWRPITAIQHADLDGNALTAADPTWQPLLGTPAFQEYPAGHPGVSQAAAAVLAAHFGERTSFTVTSPSLAGVVRSFRSFSAGVAQVIDARVFGGIHFRFAGETATTMGRAVAADVLATQMQPAHQGGPPPRRVNRR